MRKGGRERGCRDEWGGGTMIVNDCAVIVMMVRCRNIAHGADAHLHGAAPRRPAVAAVQQHVHPVPRHRLHRLLAELHSERRQPPRHRPLRASSAPLKQPPHRSTIMTGKLRLP